MTIKKMLTKNKNYDKPTLLLACKQAKEIIKKLEDGFYIELFKNGNRKLEENIKKISLPEKLTCCTSCKNCYATKRTFLNVKSFRLKFLILFEYAQKNQNFKKLLIDNITKELNIHKSRYAKPIFRLHESGDFYSLNYFKLWLEIIQKNKKIKFYGYTKNPLIFNEFLKIKDNYKNLNIINSYNLNGVNFYNLVKEEEITRLEKFLKYCYVNNKKIFLCNYGLKELKALFIKKGNVQKYNDIFLLLKKYEVDFYKTHKPCGVCDICTRQKYDYVIFLKH